MDKCTKKCYQDIDHHSMGKSNNWRDRNWQGQIPNFLCLWSEEVSRWQWKRKIKWSPWLKESSESSPENNAEKGDLHAVIYKVSIWIINWMLISIWTCGSNWRLEETGKGREEQTCLHSQRAEKLNTCFHKPEEIY